MVRSMTGFGRAKNQINGFDVTVEIKSVNHRYFEFSLRIPRSYNFLEEKIKNFLSQKISRGKVEVSILIDDLNQNSTVVEINREYADAYIKALGDLSKEYKIKNDLKVSTLALNSEMFKVRRVAVEDEVIEAAIMPVLEEAVENFIAMRSVEGERLLKDVTSRTENILSKVEFVEARSPETVTAYKEKITQKIKEMLSDNTVDEQRVLTEVAIFADKVAVNEETVRLTSHFDEFYKIMSADEPAGRRLDFLIQAINREINTTGSKANDIEIARYVVELKGETEKLREQIQNIE